MFGANLLILVASLAATVTILHAAAVPVKRSVLEESVVSLLKAEEKNNRDFQSTVLKTLSSFREQLGDIRNKSGEEKSNNKFQSTVLETLTRFHNQLEDMRNKTDFQHTFSNALAQFHVEVKNLFGNASKTYDERYNALSEKLSSSFDRILNTLYCPNQYYYVEHSCFKISNESVDWKTANAKCLQGNSHLVSVDSSDTRNAALRSLVGEESLHNDGFIWAGRNATGKDVYSSLDSNLLTPDHRALLNKWLPGKEFKLLYRTTRDGMTPSSFHRKCDGKGATISIGKDFSSNTTFGGYASVSWASVDDYKPDSNAFVFRLCRQGCTSAKYSQYQHQQYAVYHYSNYGPLFGYGGDLVFFSGSTTYDSTNKYFPSNGYCHVTDSLHTYTRNLGCGRNVKWVDVEVWSVVDAVTDTCLALNPINQKLERKPCTDEARYICEL